MPLIIGAFDKLKAAALAVPASGATLAQLVKSKVVHVPGRTAYVTPAEAYRYQLVQKMQRQYAVNTYAAFCHEIEKFNPSDDKAKLEEAKQWIPSRENNVVEVFDWTVALQKGGYMHWMVEKNFELYGTAVTVYFIRHAHDHRRLKRIEYTCPGEAAPVPLLMSC